MLICRQNWKLLDIGNTTIYSPRRSVNITIHVAGDAGRLQSSREAAPQSREQQATGNEPPGRGSREQGETCQHQFQGKGPWLRWSRASSRPLPHRSPPSPTRHPWLSLARGTARAARAATSASEPVPASSLRPSAAVRLRQLRSLPPPPSEHHPPQAPWTPEWASQALPVSPSSRTLVAPGLLTRVSRRPLPPLPQTPRPSPSPPH
jgi:hypothetical protein